GPTSRGAERELAWSPDGRSLAWVEQLPDAKSRIWVSPLPLGGTPMALTDGKSRDDMPAWSPDGRYLVFVSNRTTDVELFLVRADGTGPTQLTHSPGADWLPRWWQ